MAVLALTWDGLVEGFWMTLFLGIGLWTMFIIARGWFRILDGIDRNVVNRHPDRCNCLRCNPHYSYCRCLTCTGQR